MPMMMSMPPLKLTMAASLCATPYKQLVFRHITTRKISSPKLYPSPFTSLSGCRIPPCALPVPSPSPSAHVSLQPHNSLSLSLPFSGFRYRSPKLYISSRTGDTTTRSSTNKAEVTGSDPESPSDPGSGLVADMDHQDNVKAVNGGWYCDQTPSPSIQQHQPSNKILTLPTILTLGRVAAVPLLICTFYVDSWWGRTTTTSIFIAAAVTDWLDGYIARKMRLGSTFGAFLDPVADKLMVAATLVLLCTKPLELPVFGQVPWLLTVPAIAIIGREITMSAVREWAASQNTRLLEAVAVNNLGKWKTATQMIALTILLTTRDSSIGGPWILVCSGVVLLYISAGLSVWSLVVYMGKISKVLLK
ncbi:hypothetical protein WN944_018376 [Citrus x changshan-huyou]|uniref:CDP-diacylglycerol--glycerol-3-phosphate 1-phosphatidyltransferase n=1 Tax=Citrus x changshan-huyou TaxID=2935761 RepID=A0AAP0LW72_9ROSI